MTQGRARVILGDNEESLRHGGAGLFAVSGRRNGSRDGRALCCRLGRDKEAIERLAEAFIIPGLRAPRTPTY